jgi:hypothetical protein
MSEESNTRILRWVRMGALFGGMGALVLAMVVFPVETHARDAAFVIGVALLILSLVANRLLKPAP